MVARGFWSVVLVTTVALGVAACGGDDEDSASPTTVPEETVPTHPAGELDGPVTGGTRGFPATPAVLDLDAAGYVEEEFLLAGTATSYEPEGELGLDGRWEVAAAEERPYTTRILVRRPADPDGANGSVVVEWHNVSSKVDVDVDFGYLGEELVRSGTTWVGVSAQEVAITSTGDGQFGAAALGLKAWDPERYAELEHPGDAWSYDIFSQAGAAVREASGTELLGGVEVEDVIAVGESQSAFRMLTYVNAVHPVARVFDGFLIHSRNGSGAPFADGMVEEAKASGIPEAAQVRTDLDAPVLQLLTETDLFQLGAPFPPARQPDSEVVRTWEIAGTAHADGAYLRGLHAQGLKQYGEFLDLTGVFDVANNGPQGEVARAAIRALQVWVREGTSPPKAPPLEVGDGAILRDEHGNALGGVRTPDVDVPIATLTGEGGGLIGSTKPFDAAMLAALYPTHDDYVGKVRAAADVAVEAGFLLEEDAEAMVAEAEAAPVPG